MKRLKTKGIVSLQPKRIMISGKVRVYAFDKTGTLTKDGLDFLGFRPVVPAAAGTGGPARLGKLAHPGGGGLDPGHMLGLATCHSAETCGNTVIANEVEVTEEGEGAGGGGGGGGGAEIERGWLPLPSSRFVWAASPKTGIRKRARPPARAPPSWS